MTWKYHFVFLFLGLVQREVVILSINWTEFFVTIFLTFPSFIGTTITLLRLDKSWKKMRWRDYKEFTLGKKRKVKHVFTEKIPLTLLLYLSLSRPASNQEEASLCGIEYNIVNVNIAVSELELKLYYYTHFQTNTLEKSLNSSVMN